MLVIPQPTVVEALVFAASMFACGIILGWMLGVESVERRRRR